MKTSNNILSKLRLKRLRAQGYFNYNDQELSNMAFGIRFAYRLCVGVILTAAFTQSIEIFSFMLVVAFFGTVTSSHPFDHIYNFVLSKRMNKPRIPGRAVQLKFACGMATVWLGATVYLMAIGSTSAGVILGGTLGLVALLPSTIDLCVPSTIYNSIFKRKATTA